MVKFYVHIFTYMVNFLVPVARTHTKTCLFLLFHILYVSVYRFFVQIYLDYFMYAQTCAKTRVDDTLFWGEPFTFV